MKTLLCFALLLAASFATADDQSEDKTCTLLDNSKPAKAKFHCVDGKKIYHVECDISATPESTSGKWGVKDHKTGIELPGKDSALIFAKCGDREMFVMGGMQGDAMGIDITEKMGRTYFVASEILGRDDVKLRSIERNRIDIQLGGNERFTAQTTGFKCKTATGELVYAVINRSKAKRAEAFSPVRAWTPNEKTFKLWPVKNVSAIKCSWDPESEEPYPF